MKLCCAILILGGSLFAQPADNPFRTSPPGLTPAAVQPDPTPAPTIVYVQGPPQNGAQNFTTSALAWISALTIVAGALSAFVAKILGHIKEIKERQAAEIVELKDRQKADIDDIKARQQRQFEKSETQAKQIVSLAAAQPPPGSVFLGPPVAAAPARVRARLKKDDKPVRK